MADSYGPVRQIPVWLIAALICTVGVTPPLAEGAARRIVVAETGGDYTSVSAALAAINPTPQEPYVIDVMPGRYPESIFLKSYVSLRGSGREVTTIWSPSTYQDVIQLREVERVSISGLTIFGGYRGIAIDHSRSVTVENNTIFFNQGDGIAIESSPPVFPGAVTPEGAPPVIQNNIISSNSLNGISISNSPAIVQGNSINRNGGTGVSTSFSAAAVTGNVVSENWDGIWTTGYFPTAAISDNVVTNNQSFGIYAYAPASIVRNTVSGNSIDVVNGDGTSNFSLNVYNTVGGWTGTGRGQFNVTTDGGIPPAP